MADHEPPVRIRVTGPHRATAPHRRDLLVREIDEQTEIGEIYMRALMRSQLRLAGLVIAVLGLTLGLLPVVFLLWPATRTQHLLGIPLPWLLLGVAVYPVLLGLGWFYVRQAERNERDFTELVERE
ncbi:MAG TPA: hypothetical protein VFI30_06475 [Nocardioidaceae bacterium]|nr:hypothetical protein [Nocardioidaceae bacterium]